MIYRIKMKHQVGNKVSIVPETRIMATPALMFPDDRAKIVDDNFSLVDAMFSKIEVNFILVKKSLYL